MKDYVSFNPFSDTVEISLQDLNSIWLAIWQPTSPREAHWPSRTFSHTLARLSKQPVWMLAPRSTWCTSSKKSSWHRSCQNALECWCVWALQATAYADAHAVPGWSCLWHYWVAFDSHHKGPGTWGYREVEAQEEDWATGCVQHQNVEYDCRGISVWMCGYCGRRYGSTDLKS